MSSQVVGLDRADRRMLERLNSGRELASPLPRDRVKRLVEYGFVEERILGGVAITPRGQLELARQRFENLPQSKFVIIGEKFASALFEQESPRQSLFRKFFKLP